jgi:putative hemolysin
VNNDLTDVVLASVMQTLSAISGVSSADLSPIVAFELDIVGYDNGQSTTLSSGSGTITYTAANAMTVVNAEPSYCEFDGGTLETANTAYGELPTGSSTTFVQTFNKSSATIKASKRNGLIKTKANTFLRPSPIA